MEYTKQHLPAFRLTVNGIDITATIEPRLQVLELREQNGEEADSLSLTLCDHDQKLALPPHGATINLAIGWREDLTDKGIFIVDEIEYTTQPNQLHIQARAADMVGSLPLKIERDWQKTTLGQVIQDIASANNLKASVSEKFKSRRMATLHKDTESDLNFLTRLAKSYGALFSVKAGHILFIEKGQPVTASGIELPKINLHVSQLASSQYVRQQRNDITGVRAKWRDIEAAKYVWELAGEAERTTDLSKICNDAETALEEARAHWQDMARGRDTFFLVLARGDATLNVAAPLIISGIKSELDALRWQITSVRHTLDRTGFVTDVAAEKLL